MKKFSVRKFWYFDKHKKSIHIELAGWNSHPSLYMRVDGGERDLVFHFGFGIGIWLVFENFLPKNWYPTYHSKYTNSNLPEERQLYIAFHNGSFWWDFWVSEEWSSYTKNKTWRKGCWHIVDRIKGKHTMIKNEIERRQFALPFLEGNYNIEVIKKARTDKWPRWFTRKMISFEVKVGYYESGNFIEQGIPVEGKGENSWDCDEDATYSMYFAGQPYNKNVISCYDAALYFWHSMMKSRERHGSPKWLPQAFKEKGIQTIKK